MPALRSISLVGGALVTLVLVAGGTEARVSPASATRGQQLADKLECARCHDGAGLKPAPRDKHCVHCHQAIERGAFDATADTIARWQKDIVHLKAVPTLEGMGRFDESWLASFLTSPTDLRPRMGASMPRFDLDDAQARDLAAWLTRAGQPEVPAWIPRGDVARGRALVDSTGCGQCHVMRGVPPLAGSALPPDLPPARLSVLKKLAPDLSVARERMTRRTVAAWLRDPTALKKDALMPATGLSDEQIGDVVAFLFDAKLDDSAAPAVPERLPVLERAVTFDEVNGKVFKKTCWHCHAEPAFAFGDGGAGNTGGFGFRARRLDLSSYEAVLSGSIDDDGRRRSIFKKLDEQVPVVGGLPLVLAHMVARQAEEHGLVVGDVRGMPLGLPAPTAEEVQLVESWIAQGRRR
jgi:mono/diheme cytochrome c family protein